MHDIHPQISIVINTFVIQHEVIELTAADILSLLQEGYLEKKIKTKEMRRD
ncbi:hypothetical protein HOLleu_38729 [Holothuria leucospilota]|uniref:Uncharacterized protein n=1 Tax=Holothuria leucospilota TaxID=206669 RepID=A0A9Q1BEB6_HOLLE|nr:hypothetical protein HOLleu_38729 [Holothuria leucospilota]